MNRRRTQVRSASVFLSAAAVVAAGLYAAGADTPKPAAPPQGAAKKEVPAAHLPKPGPEHAALAKQEGTWDASVEIMMGPPGSPPQRSKGTETSRLCCGGLWLLTEFRSDPSNPAFEGHGITGYDTSKKKYVAIWVDTDLTAPMISEGVWDAAARTLTVRGSMSANGKAMRWRGTDVWKDDDTRQYTLYRPGQDGRETPTLSIAYTRRR